MQSDSQELAVVAASALVNLCNYSEDIKEIFFQHKGLNVILEYLDLAVDKHQDTLEMVLRLMQILMAKSEQHTKKICEENDQEAVKSLLKILEGPGLKNTSFSTLIIRFVINILRMMIKHSFKAKSTIFKNKTEKEPTKSSLSIIVDMVEPSLHKLALREHKTLEVCVYQFLGEFVMEENEYKRFVGGLMFLRIFHKRIKGILTEREEEDDLHDHSVPVLSGEVEEQFFKLISILTKNNPENAQHIKSMKPDLVKYQTDGKCE